MTIVSIFCEKETSNKCKITKSFRVVTITAAIVGSFIICVQMLISWTYNTSSVIEGVQGRYFLPFVPMLFMGFASNKFSIKKDYNKFIIAAFGLLQCATVIAILVKTIY